MYSKGTYVFFVVCSERLSTMQGMIGTLKHPEDTPQALVDDMAKGPLVAASFAIDPTTWEVVARKVNPGYEQPDTRYRDWDIDTSGASQSAEDYETDKVIAGVQASPLPEFDGTEEYEEKARREQRGPDRLLAVTPGRGQVYSEREIERSQRLIGDILGIKEEDGEEDGYEPPAPVDGRVA